MGDDEVEAAGHRLVGDRDDRVDSEEHLADGGCRVAAHQPDGVPRLGQRGRVQLVQSSDDVPEGAHVSKARAG
jgi:hypothetical protein